MNKEREKKKRKEETLATNRGNVECNYGERNYKTLLQFTFSYRSLRLSADEKDNLDKILRLIDNNVQRARLRTGSLLEP